MQKITMFFWQCSGAHVETLRKCPTESSKYVGIGATVFFTGLFAALSAAYALYTIFDSILAAIGFGIIWGLMIFNLDRYIVSSMRKEGKPRREFILALPRIFLAILISIVIAKPLELKIFEKEIRPELVVMEQETYARQEQQLRARFTSLLDSLGAEIQSLKGEIVSRSQKRDELMKLAQEEADGTGGSKRRNLGPIYKVKKENADAAQKELTLLEFSNGEQIQILERIIQRTDSSMVSELNAMEKNKIDGLAARMEALSRITKDSAAITWAHWFVLFLFIALETAPVFVKLISAKGPYDNLLKIVEHRFSAEEIEETARTNAGTKNRAGELPEHEKNFISNALDAKLSG